MTYFDTHFHLESMKAKSVLDGLAAAEGMDIGCEPGDIDRRLELMKRFSGLHFSIAAGPWCLRNGTEVQDLVSLIRKDCDRHRPDFIGETGIDRYWNYGREGEMEELFRLHLRLADELDLPVVVHSRDADSETAGILRDQCPRRRGIIHCFSSDTAAARTFLDLGFMISFAGNVTYKANEELRKAAAYVPLDRILLETDSPYLSPVPLRGRPNTPASIVHTYTLVAGLRGLAPQQLDEIVRDNYLSILQGTV